MCNQCSTHRDLNIHLQWTEGLLCPKVLRAGKARVAVSAAGTCRQSGGQAELKHPGEMLWRQVWAVLIIVDVEQWLPVVLTRLFFLLLYIFKNTRHKK